jgi:hypothetical protein
MERNENAQEDAFWEFFGEKTKQKTEFTTSRDLKTRPDRRRPAVSCSAKGSWSTT